MKRLMTADPPYLAAEKEVQALAGIYGTSDVTWGCDFESRVYYIVLKTGPGLNFFAQSQSNSMLTGMLRSKFQETHESKEM